MAYYNSATLIATGTRVPYHTTSRVRLPEVTADALRSAAVRLPAETLRQTGTWYIRGHLNLSPEARQLLPPIMGGSRREVSYGVSAASRGVLLRAAEAGTSRRAVAGTMHLDSMGFADPGRDGRPPGPMAVAELAGGLGSGRPRDAGGRFTTDERGGLDDRASRDASAATKVCLLTVYLKHSSLRTRKRMYRG